MRSPCCHALLVALEVPCLVVALCRCIIHALFFCSGNRRTGEVAWEQDIRPSDATYLAEQWKVPFYIDSGVWHETAITHSELQESERDYELPFDRPGDKESARDGTLQAPDPDSREPVVLTHSVDAPVDAAGIMCVLLCPGLTHQTFSRYNGLAMIAVVLPIAASQQKRCRERNLLAYHGTCSRMSV